MTNIGESQNVQNHQPCVNKNVTTIHHKKKKSITKVEFTIDLAAAIRFAYFNGGWAIPEDGHTNGHTNPLISSKG